MWYVEDPTSFLLKATSLGDSFLVVEKPGAFQLLLERIGLLGSFGHSWESFTFLKEAKSAGWEAKHPACSLSLSIRARPAHMTNASLLDQWDKDRLERVAGYCDC